MGYKLGLAALAAACLFAAAPQNAAQAMRAPPLTVTAAALVLDAAQEGGPRFHHGRRGKTVYCLDRTYWWFYRPYTTAPADFPRCEPYFHYLEPAYGPPRAKSDNYYR
ncbi:MAG: hypothetical protein ACRECX_01985 [Methyloceanibacter sp.]|uniref:hypothetical protein n=1 Tax=Methyloceanibacter sp. TaxID=1965321 RepID=UPI003D6CD525